MINVWEARDANKRKTWLIMLVFVLFITGVSYVFAQALDFGPGFIGMALVFSGITSFASYWWSDKIVLAISRAKPASNATDPTFYSVAQNLSLAAGLPQPRLYVIEDSAMNAFATGRDPAHAVVCATRGLLDRLNRTELEAVTAHELAHVGNYDIRLASIVAVLVGMVTLLADWLLRSTWSGRRSRDEKGAGTAMLAIAVGLALLSPLIAKLIQLAISRRQEYRADAQAVLLTRQPSGLISALKKLSVDREPLEAANKATAHLYIVNPLKNLHSGIGWFAGLFATHPPIEARVAQLEKML